MTELEDRVSAHYDTGAILARIRSALAAAGADPDNPDPSDLKGVDEFHTGGIEATEALLAPLGIGPATRVLDIGCGIGGTARYVASRWGATVTGVDLTPAFVETATALSRLCGLGERTRFVAGSALDLPVGPGSADLVTMFHVGMNIADKPALFAAAARALAPGGRFALFDLMERDGGGHGFPVPWASAPEESFVAPPEVYRAAAAGAGLRLVAERDRHAYAVRFFDRVIRAAEETGPPPVGLHLIMGETAQQKYGNAAAAVQSGALGPWEMTFERPA